ncbi:ATP-dependent helicase [Bradyrhizobium sp. G127]|uniref:UvrD-helicase domain-containing protein n=1 Tax=Bradyrhizobium sp. G127 TaxID=2904800 RepID=UPI001F22E5FA|nr:ATP-dependent helicase [Bradyrhizobium sp. G127]MCF2521658.1 ATP-dependent helicase [Bradyrhizobium sp. G127]
MTPKLFRPTDEQTRIIHHDGSAFISACPGAGKTRVLVERARFLSADQAAGRGVAFLSFTIAAVSELEDRLRHEGLLETPVFPHFIGTFDAFLWQFLISPFGVPGCVVRPRLIPDKDQRSIQPFAAARALPLECFDRSTGNAIPELLARHGFKGQIKAHETAARNTRTRFLERGEIDFTDARDIALARLRDPASSAVLARALGARFRELVVDEAQDCNPLDLGIISWFKDAKIPVKVICDPHQAIYGFRGGVTSELEVFAQTFQDDERLPMTGNFRSSRHIAKAIVALRAPNARSVVDHALGKHRDDPTPVYVLSYRGNSVPASVGIKFRELTEALQLDPGQCPVLAATRRSGANALGHPVDNGVKDLSYRLAVAISDYHFSFELGGRKEGLEAVHRIMLELEGHTADKTYHQHIADAELEPGDWRARVLELVEELRFDPARFATVDAWHDHARVLLAPLLPVGGQSINQRLRRNVDLPKALSTAPPNGHSARTIHSVKGMEFPAVCVVMSSRTAKGILDFLSASNPTTDNEEARKIYVGASRAQRLLTIAVPRSQASRLVRLLQSMKGDVSLIEL